ncbi:flagellin [Succinimonas amylolytica]|uniref:flagellin N-terminal helical domain-containing protein n=1 Tax=Succinimonas amylolytica TaxID=83769 RepID=UPI00037AC4D9|nr:flagellin [Succinimonas amylolytica]
MALYVNTNVSSLNANRNLANSTAALDVSYRRLASGLRINSAKDDAAGLQISNRLTSQINGLNQGNRNAQDGISYSQTAEGAMDEMTAMYQRIRTLALQSANGSNSQADRDAIQQEVTQLCTEITRIGEDTTYGGTHILNKSITTLTDFQVGANANEVISIDLTDGFRMNDVYTTIYTDANTTAAEKTQLDSAVANTGDTSAHAAGIHFDVSSQTAAQDTLAVVDKFVAVIDAKRAELGAVQNRLESTIRNQTNVSENVSDARSRIRDADFATETAAMTQQNILQQASQSILSQANQRPQIALSLLQS